MTGRSGGADGAPLSDADIIAACRGDREAFDRLVRGLNRLVLSVVARVYRPDEDAAQEAWIRAWRYRGTFRGRTVAEFTGWLATIAVRAAIDEFERTKRAPSPVDPATLTTRVSSDCPSGGVAADDVVHRALASLEPRARAVMFLSTVIGLSGVEIARELAIPIGSVYSSLSRARAALREMADALEVTP